MALKSKDMNKVRETVPVAEVAPKEDAVRINLNVPMSVRARWKAEAATRGKRSLAEMIIEAVEQSLSK